MVLDSIDLVVAGSTDLEVVDYIDLGAGHSILAGSSAALAGTAGLVGDLAASSVDTDSEAAPAVEDIHQLAGTANVPVADHSPAAADSIVVDMVLKEVSPQMPMKQIQSDTYAAVHQVDLDSTTYSCLRYCFHKLKDASAMVLVGTAN